ncbi:hypothetical protein [Galactobacter caseinivorans]|uniref:Uncharacterized protein n=1 Tax=Galactobacter caseinivorans TaxID=2676123 RepID=A0A496PI22_9MICC|nr:hypothetical protein [Galactobacter caseinivorans]RKW70100.1 hypothetical protein DWQ67_09075 [Galactobacter caseinivorans]
MGTTAATATARQTRSTQLAMRAATIGAAIAVIIGIVCLIVIGGAPGMIAGFSFIGAGLFAVFTTWVSVQTNNKRRAARN